MDCRPPASLSMGFPRQEYWSGLPFPSPGDFLDPGIEPAFPVMADGFFTTGPLYCYSVYKSCLTLCDPMDCSTPGFPVLHYLPDFAQVYVHWVGDAIWPSHPLLPSSPFAFCIVQYNFFFKCSLLHIIAFNSLNGWKQTNKHQWLSPHWPPQCLRQHLSSKIGHYLWKTCKLHQSLINKPVGGWQRKFFSNKKGTG